MSETARERVALTEAVAKAVEATMPFGVTNAVRIERGYYDFTDSATAAIAAYNAYLWERAGRPEVVQAEAKRLRDVHGKAAWDRLGENGRDVWREEARAGFTTLLTALIGPRPKGADDDTHR